MRDLDALVSERLALMERPVAVFVSDGQTDPIEEIA